MTHHTSQTFRAAMIRLHATIRWAPRSDRGSVTICVLACVLVAVLASGALVGLGTRAAAQARTEAAADLVAMAAAHDPTALAAAVAMANRVQIARVSRRGESTAVEVWSGTLRGRSSAHLTTGAVG